MNIGDRVKLISFNNSSVADDNCDEQENYWKLVGETGFIVAEPNLSDTISSDRLCIQFNVDVKSLNLHCHNEIPNSLWILASDLQVLNP